MNVCFFTMSNDKMIEWARALISSCDAVDRPIWMFGIPPNHPDPKRYKLELLAGDVLPVADKYVYMDADSLMIQHGDWESDDCVGAKHESWMTALNYANAFPKMTGWGEYVRMYNDNGCPDRMNSGLVVLPGDIRKAFASRWQYWNEKIDSFTPEFLKVRDQMGFAFAYQEFNLPKLPERFSAIPKRETVKDHHITMHLSGRPSGNAIKPYHETIERLLGGVLKKMPIGTRNVRWQVLTRLLLHGAENPAFPTMAEVGVFKGETVRHMLNTFPGLRTHCIDNRAPMGAEKRHTNTEQVWEALCREYPARIIYYRMDGMKAALPEKLDLIFEDSDHRTDAVIEHAKHFWPMLRVGGFYAVHDIDYDGTYYDKGSVRRAMDQLFGDRYRVGPDHMAWVRKKSEAIL